jgi:hypothetical protein
MKQHSVETVMGIRVERAHWLETGRQGTGERHRSIDFTEIQFQRPFIGQSRGYSEIALGKNVHFAAVHLL